MAIIPTASQIFSKIDSDMELEIRNSSNRDREHSLVNTAAPTIGAVPLAMPDYVEHRKGVTEIGKLSAQAIVGEYEAAAKDIEAMGSDLLERVKQCEAMTRDAMAVTEEMKETAARYREEAKRVFTQIENCSLVTAEVRKACTEMMKKIATPT